MQHYSHSIAQHRFHCHVTVKRCALLDLSRLATLVLSFSLVTLEFTLGEDTDVVDLERALANRRGLVASVASGGESYLQVQIHRETDAALRSLAQVSIDARRRVKRVIIKEPCTDTRSLLLLARFDAIESLDICENGWASPLSKVVADLPSLTELWAEGSGIRGDDLRSIAKARQLEILMIGRNRFKGSDLESLRSLHRLTQLSLSNMPIETKDLQFIEATKELQCLQLVSTQVDDDIIPIVRNCKHLTLLALAGSKVTQRGVAKLSQERPSIIVSYGRDD